MFAYVHEKINILLSVLRILFIFFYFNLNTQGFVYLEFVKFQLDLHRTSRKHAYIMLTPLNPTFI